MYNRGQCWTAGSSSRGIRLPACRMGPGLVQQGYAANAENVSRVGMMIVGERKYSNQL